MPRPKITPPYSQPEKLLQILSVFALIGLITLTVLSMMKLPQTIPTHFGFDGRADGWGGKDTLIVLAIAGVIFYTLLTLLEKFPWIGNYLVEITEENAAKQYRLCRILLEWVKLFFLVNLLAAQWQIWQVARGLSTGPFVWVLPVSLLVVFTALGITIYRMVKQK